MATARVDRARADVRPLENGQARRRRATEERLLDAALATFLAHGYDAATTGEMARRAGVAAGTFYLHFRDKRAAYERLARRAADDLLGAWRKALAPGTAMRDALVRGLELAARYWRDDPARARLLLEGGPSLGGEGHLRLVDEIASVLAATAAPDGARPDVSRSARSHAFVLLGLGIELGRLVAAQPEADADVARVVELVGALLPRG
jgi:AcrR family transcriptional regulator